MERRTEEEVSYLIEQYQKGNREAEKALVEKYYPLVKSVALRYLHYPAEREELEQVGNMGLFKAMQRFDASRGTKFSTFATVWVKGEILTFLRKGQGWLKTGPARPGKQSQISLQEAARSAGLSNEEMAASTEYSRVFLPGEPIEDTPSGEHLADETVRRVWLKEAIKKLDSQGRKVIFYRYFQGKTQEEVGDILGISQRQVSRIEKRVLSEMKKSLGSYLT